MIKCMHAGCFELSFLLAEQFAYGLTASRNNYSKMYLALWVEQFIDALVMHVFKVFLLLSLFNDKFDIHIHIFLQNSNGNQIMPMKAIIVLKLWLTVKYWWKEGKKIVLNTCTLTIYVKSCSGRQLVLIRSGSVFKN